MTYEKLKISFVTGTRAEYGILYWLLKEFQNEPRTDLRILATGTHLSPEFGNTYTTIEEDGFVISDKVELLLSSDTSVGLSKSVGLGVISFSEIFNRSQPDIVVLVGDRFEALAACQAAFFSRVPVAHIHGGEITKGALDDSIRHCITKMASIHFVTAEEHRKRVIQLGENPETVFDVGSPGLDNISNLQLFTREELEKDLDFHLGNQSFLVTFHPETTLNSQLNLDNLKALLCAFQSFEDARIIITMPNADPCGRLLQSALREFGHQHPERIRLVTNLGQTRYLSAMREVDVVIGNSSSGLIEAPALKTPTVNIGNRQKGRLRGDTVIDTPPQVLDIKKAIEKALDPKWRACLVSGNSPYGEPGASRKIKDILMNSHFPISSTKAFFDLSFQSQP